MCGGDIGLIVEFGACLNEWKQSKRAPLLERKLAMRKELDRLMETPKAEKIEALRADLATLQKRLDEARRRGLKNCSLGSLFVLIALYIIIPLLGLHWRPNSHTWMSPMCVSLRGGCLHRLLLA